MAVYGNRYLNDAQEFSLSPAQVVYDAGPLEGGNYWSSAPNVKPYAYFITDATTGSNDGQYQDRYPYPNESLGNEYAVEVLTPQAGSYVAQGSQKTIAWTSRGCVYVDVSYVPPTSTPVPIVTNYPDYGFYQWTVGTLPPGSGYSIEVDCKQSNGSAVGVSSVSEPFSVTSSDLILLTPGREMMSTSGQAILVAWKTAVYHPVDILIRSNSASSWVPLATSVTTDNLAVVLPSWTSDQASI